MRDEAADWFAIMRGPGADAQRVEFEAWLARGALHRSAYNRIAETFSIGKGLKPTAPGGEEPNDEPGTEWTPKRLILLAVVATAALGGALSLVVSRTEDSGRKSIVMHPQRAASNDSFAQLSTRVGEIKTLALSDGSSVILDTDSLLAVAFTSRERGLRLMRGRGRFVVAHASQPFIVRAGGGTVTAHGTIFDVGLAPGDQVHVRLLRGAVDVETRSMSKDGSRLRRAKRMTPGEQITFGKGDIQEQPARAGTAVADSNWPEEVRDFDHIRLADLVSEANRYATSPLVLSSGDLGNLRISGRFRLRNTRGLADNLAEMLRLHLTVTPENIALSRPCSVNINKSCAPLS